MTNIEVTENRRNSQSGTLKLTRDPGKPRTVLNAVEVLYNYTDEELRSICESEEYTLDPTTQFPAIMKNLKARLSTLGLL